jgi:hypothetical protein
MAQLVEALRYKPEGRDFESRCCHWNFSVTHNFCVCILIVRSCILIVVNVYLLLSMYS